MMRFASLAVIGLAVFASADAEAVQIRAACWRPTNDSIHLLVFNNGRRAVRIAEVWLDKTELLAARALLPPKRGCRWVRVAPETIPAGKAGDVTICLLTTDQKSYTVEVVGSDGSRARATVEKRALGARVCGMYFSPRLDRIHVYIRAERGGAVPRRAKIEAVRIDGRPADVVATWPRLYRGAGYVCVRCDGKPAQPHVVEVDLKSDGTTVTVFGFSYAFHVPSVIGTYGNSGDQFLRDYAAHGLNCYLGFGAPGRHSHDVAAEVGLWLGGNYSGPVVDGKTLKFLQPYLAALTRMAWLREHPAHLFTQLPDEPDGGDYRFRKLVGGNYYWSCGAQAQHLVERVDWLHQQDPRHFVLVQIDNTFVPYNMMCYGELCDVPSSHLYSLGQRGGLQAMLSRHRQVKACGEPRPAYAVLQFTPVPIASKKRMPTLEEMQWQQYAALAAGCHGAIYYIHSGSRNAAGGPHGPWQAMTALHKQMARLHRWRWMAEPVDWARSTTEGVEAQALLAGQQALIVVLIDERAESLEDGYHGQSYGNVGLTVDLPQWLAVDGAALVEAGGLRSVAAQRRGNRCKLSLDEVKTGAIVLLRLKPAE